MVLLVENCQDEERPINSPYEENLNLNSVISVNSSEPSSIIELLSVSVAKNDQITARNCVETLSRKITKDNALYCFYRLKLKPHITRTQSYEPSAPLPISKNNENTKENRNEDWVADLEDNIRNICLLEIDKNADYILKQKELLDLEYEDFLSITTRDTLEVSSELVVYSAIMRWGQERQRRKGCDGEEINMKNWLQDLIYAPRYGLMSKAEFLIRTIDDGIQGPDRSGILKESEIQLIMNYIKKKSKKESVPPLPYKGSEPRRRRNSSGNNSMNPVCEKHLLNFLTCWTAVFD